jgi:hypothetical protein
LVARGQGPQSNSGLLNPKDESLFVKPDKNNEKKLN